MHDFQQKFQAIWQAFSGEAALQTVADISRFHRIQASPGYRAAARLLHERLALAGLDVQIQSYPADEGAQFWSWNSFQEWDCEEATLRLVEPADEAATLADYRACPISVIQRSTSYHGEAELVLLEDGEEEEEYEGLDLRGKMVLTRGDVHRVRELAVVKHGAIGILSDGLRAVPPVRPAGDLADARQYTSFWYHPGDTACFGFVLTPRQGQSLRTLWKDKGTTVRLNAQVSGRLYDGAFEVVDALIPGAGDRPAGEDRPAIADSEIIVVTHLCHPLPSANDNASGAAAAFEAARALQALIDSGDLPRPRRAIRFLWVPEMTGTYAYLAGREQELERLVAGINLDMVGEDQEQTGSVWLIDRPPEASASFAPALLTTLRESLLDLKGMTGVSAGLTGQGGYPLYRQAETPFTGGSDHIIFSDPTAGVPMPALGSWPDRFYHTSADTPDRVDPQSLARSGTLAAAYAYWLASAGLDEATWLGYQMVARYKTTLVDAAQKIVTAARDMEGGTGLAQTLQELDRRLAYLQDRQKAALRTLERLAGIECLLPDLEAEVERASQRELAWARGVLELHATTRGWAPLPEAGPPPLSGEEQEAARLVPRRLVKGPINLSQHTYRLQEKDREAWRKLLKARKDWGHFTFTALALYWTDGASTILDISHLVEMECGATDLGLLLAYFRLLDELGFVSMGALA